MKKLGLIVNPIAGMGGRVGLKGTDGEIVYRQALALGAQPRAHFRAVEALKVITDAIPEVTLIACAKSMGEEAARECGILPILIDGALSHDCRTSAEDTRRAALEMRHAGVDILLFAGGDGTARDICDALGADALSADTPITDTPNESAPMAVLGIPAGVKMHSGVFAISPSRAGEIALRFLRGESLKITQLEVMDIDEDAFRSGRVAAKLYGYLNVPQDSQAVQTTKSGAVQDLETPLDIARQVVADMEEDTVYIIGPGTTTAAISDALGTANTLLGVDVVLNKILIAKDAGECELLNLTEGKPAKIIVSVIGGQGYIIGRGNQQISARLIRSVGKDNIIVAATRSKLLELSGRPILVDSGDSKLDEDMSGYIKVVTGFRESHIYKVSH